MSNINRSRIMEVTGYARRTLIDLELRGIIPKPERDEKGRVWYGKTQIEALIQHYQRQGKKVPEGLKEHLRGIKQEGVSMDEAK